MNPEIMQILDLLYSEYPASEPDWAAIKTLIFTFDNPTKVMLELMQVMFIYAEDPSAFEELIYFDKSQ